MKKERLVYFDIIKFIAVICVFTVHFTRTLEYFLNFDFKILPDRIFGVYLGGFGVTLFFITSGASLMYVYDEKLDLKTYIKKRFSGIFPMFWLTYFIAFLVNFYINKGFDQTIPKYRILATLIGFDGLDAFYHPNFYLLGEWFLGVIISLYILFPLLRILVMKFPWISFAMVIIVHIILVQNYSPASALPLECVVFARLVEFMFGMLFIRYIKKVNIFMFVPALAIMIVAEFVDLTKINNMYVIPVVGISSFIVFTFLFCRIKKGIFKQISIFISKYSYAIFLTHHYIMLVFIKHFMGTLQPASGIIVLSTTLVCIVIMASMIMVKLDKAVSKTISNALFSKEKIK